ncbi:MAG: sterol desaturase family protein [Leptolyngbya sp.]|nr:sterol desaturase family protein [Candidatus Melainabacteria bacterium]
MSSVRTIKVTHNPVNSNEIYLAALKPNVSFLSRTLSTLWLYLGLGLLVWFSWSEPFSGMLFDSLQGHGLPSWVVTYLLTPIVMFLRAVIAVESIGYGYHRFFQHVGFFTRKAQVFRRNQRFHWIHHMIIYPIGRLYQHGKRYHAAEKGLTLSWVLPGLMVAAIFLYWHGLSIASASFIVGFAVYAKLIVDLTHARFHFDDHPWIGKPYFQWLEEIHLLHHWDQRYNFTIVHPLMDQLFGTYLNPKTHRKELAVALEDIEITVSDLINWRYLLTEANPTEYAAFVSAAQRYPKSLRKVQHLLVILEHRIFTNPDDLEASELQKRALNLVAEVGKTSIAN